MIFILLQRQKNPTVVDAGDLVVSGIRPYLLKIPEIRRDINLEISMTDFFAFESMDYFYFLTN